MHRRTIWATTELIWLVCLVTACSIPWQSVSPGKVAGTPSSAPHATVPKAKVRWEPGRLQLGIDVYWVANARDSAVIIQAKARRIIDYAINLNANSIILSFPFYTREITSDRLHADSSTPSPAHIALFLKEAARSDMRVTLRPILNEDALVAQNPNAWRGSIEPVNRAAWFQSYQELLKPYAAVAAEYHVKTFVIGTELASLEGDPLWSRLITNVRTVFPGQLAYDENYLEYQQHDTNLPLHVFAVDAYPRFQLPDSATVGELARAWELWLGAHSVTVRRKTVLSEVGITAVAGAYSDPGKWIGVQHSPLIPVMQSHWFKAACEAVRKEHIDGLYWWEIDFDADPANPAPFQSNKITFLGRPAQQQVKACFAQLSGATA